MATQFTGEHLIPGEIGHICIIFSFVAAALSTFSYCAAVAKEKTQPAESAAWVALGRGGFAAHMLGVLGIFGALYYVIANHLFEYHYAWSHSSLDLPVKYLLSCFWEGQEGSFMLWMFWHAVLGLVVMRTAKKLETRTMAIIAFVQMILGTMLLGIYFGDDIKIGSTPFVLLRDVMQGAPIFQQPNYLSFVRDGNGLNVSLQNYWMVIHPPVLFLGFALSLIPFAYSIAALWKGDYKEFLKPTLIWSLLGGAVLGTGIMMGGRWAYESLNFGGYWAWDPVENASLVPWLTLVAGLHTLIVYRSTGRALAATFIFLIISHLLVWYSTFLTRTGILGKTSVHAFTGDGQALYYHLLMVLGVLTGISLLLLAVRWKKMPGVKTEEATFSREFWMFIGSVILFISAVIIIFSTSQPVWAPLAKTITGKDWAPPIDPIKAYNDSQVWIAILIGLLAGATLFLKYKSGDPKKLGQRLAIVAGVSALMSLFIGYTQSITTWQYAIMLYSACFGMVASIYYGMAVQKTQFKNLGPVTAHFGFAAVLLGILLSSYNKHAISFNTLGVAFEFGKGADGDAKESMENQLLFINTPIPIGSYFATYIGDSSVPGKDRRVYYKVRFQKIDSASHKVTEEFMLYPDAFINPKGNESGLSANPDTKHYLDRDIYTFINQATDKTRSDTSQYHSNIVRKAGDTIFINNGYMVFNGFTKDIKNTRYIAEAGDLPVAARLTLYDLNGAVQELQPVYVVKNKEAIAVVEDSVKQMDLYVRLNNIMVKTADSAFAEIMVRQTNPKDDYIVLKTLVFPYINVLWAGVIITVFGFFISMGKWIRMRGPKEVFPIDDMAEGKGMAIEGLAAQEKPIK